MGMEDNLSELRAQFESWISAPPFERMCDRNSQGSLWPGAYKRSDTELAWASWQEASTRYSASMPSDSNLRAQFESWISAPPFEHMCDKNSQGSLWPGAYKRSDTELAWASWQEASARYSASKSSDSKAEVVQGAGRLVRIGDETLQVFDQCPEDWSMENDSVRIVERVAEKFGTSCWRAESWMGRVMYVVESGGKALKFSASAAEEVARALMGRDCFARNEGLFASDGDFNAFSLTLTLKRLCVAQGSAMVRMRNGDFVDVVFQAAGEEGGPERDGFRTKDHGRYWQASGRSLTSSEFDLVALKPLESESGCYLITPKNSGRSYTSVRAPDSWELRECDVQWLPGGR